MAEPAKSREWYEVRGSAHALTPALTLTILLFMVPLLYIVHTMVGMAAAPVVGLAGGMLLLFLLPLLDLLAPPHRAWLPAVATLAAAAFVGIGLAGAAPTADRPAPSNLVHVQDAATDSAWWASPLGHDDAFIARFLAGSTDTMRLADFSWSLRGGPYRVAPVPAWNAAPVRVTVLSDELTDELTDDDADAHTDAHTDAHADDDADAHTDANADAHADVGDAGLGLRRVRLRLEWDADAPMMVEIRPADGATRLAHPAPGTLAGHATAGGGAQFGRWRLELWDLQRPYEVAVEGPAGEPITLVVSARYPGLPSVGETGPVRPPDRMAMPSTRWFSTISDVRVVRHAVRF